MAAKASFESPVAFARRARRAHPFASLGSAEVNRMAASNASFVRPSASRAVLSPPSAVVSFGFLASTVSYTGIASSYRCNSVRHAPCFKRAGTIVGSRVAAFPYDVAASSVRFDRDVERLHRIGVASEREQQGRFPRGGVRVPGIQPEDGVERGDRFL